MKNDTKLWEKENRMGGTLTDKDKTGHSFHYGVGLLIRSGATCSVYNLHSHKSNAEKLRIKSDSNYFNSFKE